MRSGNDMAPVEDQEQPDPTSKPRAPTHQQNPSQEPYGSSQSTDREGAAHHRNELPESAGNEISSRGENEQPPDYADGVNVAGLSQLPLGGDQPHAQNGSTQEPPYPGSTDRATASFTENLAGPVNVSSQENRQLKDALFESRRKYKVLRTNYQSLEETCGIYRNESANFRQDVITLNNKNKALEKENAKLSKEVGSVQEIFLATLKRVQPSTDADITSRFTGLRNKIRTLARSPKACDDATLEKELFAHTLTQGLPPGIWSEHKKFLMESVIWSYVWKAAFSTPFKIFGHPGEILFASWAWLFCGEDNSDMPLWPAPSEECENWRCLTISRLLRLVEENMQHKEWQYEAEWRMKEGLNELITPVYTSKKSTEVGNIIESACALAQMIGLQRSRLQLVVPRVGDFYNANDPVDKSQLEQATRSDAEFVIGSVEFSVTPGLRKWGDGHGMHFTEKLDLFPAGVHMVPARVCRK